MQNKFFILAFLVSLNLPLPAQATLIPSPDGTMIYDSDLDITWIANVNLSGSTGMNWFQAKAWAEALEFGGYDDWRLPSARDVSTGVLCSGTVPDCMGEMGYLFNVDFGGVVNDSMQALNASYGSLFYNFPIDGNYFWLNEPNENCTPLCSPPYDNAYLFRAEPDQWGPSGLQGSIFYFQNNQKYAWAVRDGSIPEPGTLLLLLPGLAALGMRRRNESG